MKLPKAQIAAMFSALKKLSSSDGVNLFDANFEFGRRNCNLYELTPDEVQAIKMAHE